MRIPTLKRCCLLLATLVMTTPPALAGLLRQAATGAAVRPRGGSRPCGLYMGISTLAVCLLGVVGCGGDSGAAVPGSTQTGGGASPTIAVESKGTVEVNVYNTFQERIEHATVNIDVGGARFTGTTADTGVATFIGLPTGAATLSVSANGFESTSNSAYGVTNGRQRWDVRLEAPGSWAVGQAFILGTQQVARAADGSALTFSVDIAAVSGENPEPLYGLTEENFRLSIYDCGWGGPRDCASDAEGNATAGGGRYGIGNGAPLEFALQPVSMGQPYLVGVVAERSTSEAWDVKGPALKRFVAALRANAVLGLASVQEDRGSTTLTPLVEFTHDRNPLLNAIDRLGDPAGTRPALLPSLLEAIRWTAAARDRDFPGRPATLLVLSPQDLSVQDIQQAVAQALRTNVHISTVSGWHWGPPEMAVRTGGIIARVEDPRQYAVAFAALDQAVAGALPYYRMQFALTGSPGTFVPGGNVKVPLTISMRTPVPSRRYYEIDIALPAN